MLYYYHFTDLATGHPCVIAAGSVEAAKWKLAMYKKVTSPVEARLRFELVAGE